MRQHADGLAVDGGVVQLLDGLGGGVDSLELDIAEATGRAVAVKLELAGDDEAEVLEHLGELALVDGLGEVAHEEVGVGVEVTVLLLVEHDLLAGELAVVHLVEAPLSLGGIVEVQVAEALGARLVVKHDARALELVAAGLEELEEVEVERRVRQVTDVEGVRRIVLFLGTRLAAGVTALAEGAGAAAHEAGNLVANPINETAGQALHPGQARHSHHTGHRWRGAAAHGLLLLHSALEASGVHALMTAHVLLGAVLLVALVLVLTLRAAALVAVVATAGHAALHRRRHGE